MPGVGFTQSQLDALSAKLDKSHVKEREQGGRKLSYIEGWHAIAEANRIFGYDAWTRETVEIKCVAEHSRKIGKEPRTRDGWGVSYIAKVRVNVNGVVREGIGAGHGIDVDVGLAHESAIKEAETDAMKRALMTFGNPFGLALYDKTQENVERKPVGLPESAMALMRSFNSAKTREELTTRGTSEATKAAMETLDEDAYQAVRDSYADNLRRFPKAA